MGWPRWQRRAARWGESRPRWPPGPVPPLGVLNECPTRRECLAATQIQKRTASTPPLPSILLPRRSLPPASTTTNPHTLSTPPHSSVTLEPSPPFPSPAITMRWVAKLAAAGVAAAAVAAAAAAAPVVRDPMTLEVLPTAREMYLPAAPPPASRLATSVRTAAAVDAATAPSPAAEVPSPAPEAPSPGPEVPSPGPELPSPGPELPSPGPEVPSPSPDAY